MKLDPNKVLIIGGATASGKSQLALRIAQETGGEIINGDSIQLYESLPLLTARPLKTDYQGISHHLYGFLDGTVNASVAFWYKHACLVIQDIFKRKKTPIVVGGTGFYLNALIKELCYIPEIPKEIREYVYVLQKTLSKEKFYQYVIQEDQTVKGVLHPRDSQRLGRALEVKRFTQKSLLEWQKNSSKTSLFDYTFIVLEPDRDELYQKINNRFLQMIEKGVVDEVAAFCRIYKNELISLSLAKTVGLQEIKDYLEGLLSFDMMIQKAQQATRRYAKKQLTWFRHQVKNKVLLKSPDSKN